MTSLQSLEKTLDTLCEQAHNDGVAIEPLLFDDHIWVGNLWRSQNSPPGTGKKWLTKLRLLASRHDLSVKLCCTAWNDKLIAYYTTQGFQIEDEIENDAFLTAPPLKDTPMSTSQNTDMSESALACLMRAVTLAKERQVRRLETLISMLEREGYDEDDITSAIKTWGQYEQDKQPAR